MLGGFALSALVATVRAWLPDWLLGPIGAALGTAVAVLGLVLLFASYVAGVRADAIVARDGLWRAKVAEASLQAANIRAEMARAADDAAAAVRAEADAAREQDRARITALEQELARVASESGDPVIYPKELVRSLKGVSGMLPGTQVNPATPRR